MSDVSGVVPIALGRGFKHVHTFGESEPIDSMIGVRGRCFVATARDVYELKDGKLVRLTLEMIESI